MRDVLEKLSITVDESLMLNDVLYRAVQVHAARGKESELVSRTTLLHAAATADVLVRAVLDANGLRIRDWERELGLTPALTFEPPPPSHSTNFPIRDETIDSLLGYQSEWPKRPLDASGMAVAILRSKEGPVHRHLRAAGVDLQRTERRLREIIRESPEPSWVRMEIHPYRWSTLLDLLINRTEKWTADHESHGITSSKLLLNVIRLGNESKGSSIEFLSNYIARLMPDGLENKVNEWVSRFERSRAPGPLPYVSRSVVALLEASLLIARRASARQVIAARHFVGAMIAQAQFGTRSGTRLLFGHLGIDPAVLARDYLNYLERSAPADRPDKISAWRQFLGVRDQGFMPRFHAEALDGIDLLETGDDIEAFATLMASNKLSPPLSIGLFGDWGSGKSFFMARLREAIRDRAQSGQADWYHERIVQIEFNAWHYVEANLWASLVDHIFNNLRLTTEPSEDTKLEERRQHLITELDKELAARATAQLEVQKAEVARNLAAQELDAKKKVADTTAVTLPNMRARDVWELVKLDEHDRTELEQALSNLGIASAVTTKEDVRKTLDDLRGSASRVRLLAVWFTSQPRALLLLAALIVLLPFGVLPLIRLLKQWMPSLPTGLMQLMTVASAVTAWIGNQLQRANPLLKRLEAARTRIDRAVQVAEADRQNRITLAEADVARTTEEVVAAKDLLEKKELAVSEAKEKLLDLSAGRRLARFIDERSASDDYRKLLGVLATVRNDFEKLSTLLDRSIKERNAEAQKAKDAYGIDRIILYIDDLDRCHPDRVVEVLQAVHLLLAFKLFVVVVGVDARWVSESLRQKHRALWRGKPAVDGGRDGDLPGYAVQPHDYLEKIFQVPFWLEPMQPATTATYIRNLLSEDIASDAPQPHGQRNAGQNTGRTGPVRGDAAGTPNSTARPLATPIVGEAMDRLEIQDKEVDFMESDPIANLVGRSPRSAKRFVNTYRFFRAGVPSRRINAFLDETGVPEYKRVLILLAIVVGAPDVSVEVFAALRKADGTMILAAFAERLRADLASTGHRREWERSAAALEFLDARCGHLVDLLPKVARYSFRPPFGDAVAQDGIGPPMRIQKPATERATRGRKNGTTKVTET